MTKKVLVLGSTGAMGTYLVPLLAQQGYQIDSVAFDDMATPLPSNVRHIRANAKENGTMQNLLRRQEHLVENVAWFVGPDDALYALQESQGASEGEENLLILGRLRGAHGRLPAVPWYTRKRVMANTNIVAAFE